MIFRIPNDKVGLYGAQCLFKILNSFRIKNIVKTYTHHTSSSSDVLSRLNNYTVVLLRGPSDEP